MDYSFLLFECAFLQPDSSGLGYDRDVVVPTQTRLWLLSAAGFAPAIREAFGRARLVATVNALADGFVTVRDDGHMKSILAAERVHLLQWRDAAPINRLWRPALVFLAKNALFFAKHTSPKIREPF